MKLKSMDDVELNINDIKNIESIRFLDLAIVPAGEAKSRTYEKVLNGGNDVFIPALSVFYDGKIIVLASTDKHFDKFVKKVREVYLKEKDRPIPGNMMEKYISIDEYTKKILFAESTTKISELYSFYEGKTPYKYPLISKEKEINGLIPLINYVLDSNLSMFSKKYKPKKDFKGYGPRGNYVLYGYVDTKYRVIPMQVQRIKNNTYKIDFANVFDDLKTLNVEIRFNRASLDIICRVKDINYLYLETYTYDGHKMKGTKEIYLEGQRKYSDTKKYDKTDIIPNISKIDEDDELDWFIMPWKAVTGFKFIEEIKDENTRVNSRKIEYIDSNDNTFINIVSAEKKLKRRKEDFRFIRDIVYEDVDKTMVGYKENDLIYIGTSFSDDGAVGEYKENYAGNHFYVVSTAEDFNEINKDNIYPIGYEYDVYNQGDLLQNESLIRKIRGI